MFVDFFSESNIEGIDTIVADINDQASLENMCAKATVVINCVGPVSHPPLLFKPCLSPASLTGHTSGLRDYLIGHACTILCLCV